MRMEEMTRSLWLLVGLALLAYATSAEAEEVWTCSPSGGSVLDRFTISPPEVTSNVWDGMHFHIVYNDDYQLVATGADTITKETVSAGAGRLHVFTIAINKVTSKFGLAAFKAGGNANEEGFDTVVEGTCLKD
jgi:hypothetical protein